MQEVDLSGQVVWQMTAAQLNAELATATCSGCNITVIGTHHDFAILPNGHLIVIASTQQVVSGTTVTGDVLIDLDQNRQPVWLWNEFDHLDINRRPYMYPDWTHTNAILYSPSDGDLIISIRHQNWLIKIDYDNGAGSGDILWHLGYQGDFTLLNADGSADTNPFDWFYAQHGPSFTTTNTSGKFSMALFDNGDDRGVSVVTGGTCGVAPQPTCYSTVPLLNLDETAMTATLVFNPTRGLLLFRGQRRSARERQRGVRSRRLCGNQRGSLRSDANLAAQDDMANVRYGAVCLPCDARSKSLSWRAMVGASDGRRSRA